MSSGPISVTTISGDTPMPDRHKGKLVIEMPLDSFDAPIDPELALMLQHILREWDEGRQPFVVEQMKTGLRACLRWAAGNLIEKKMVEKYGQEVVAQENGSTARWYLEANKVKPHVPFIGDRIEVKIDVL